jgi:hypothetical protein
MAMWQQLKTAGMEYLAFFRVRGVTKANDPIRDDLFYSTSLSAQIKMINDNPEFYMATTLTENWIGTVDVKHTVDISNYITMMQNNLDRKRAATDTKLQLQGNLANDYFSAMDARQADRMAAQQDRMAAANAYNTAMAGLY